MIENSELGLKIAENQDEVFYSEIKDNTEKDIKNLEKMLRFNREILAMAEEGLKKVSNVQKEGDNN